MKEIKEENSSNDMKFSVDLKEENNLSEPEIEMQNSNEGDGKKEELEKNKKKMKIKKIIRWVIYIISMTVMIGVMFHSKQLYDLIASYTFLPEKYLKYLGYVLIGVNAFFSIIAFLPNINNLNKILQTILCLILAYSLVMVTTLVHDSKGQLERMFIEIPTEGELMINVYVLTESEINDIHSLQGKIVGIQSQLDVEYQDYALKVINRELEGKPVESKSYDDIYSIVEALYAGEIDAILLNESYADIVSENEDFLTFKEKTKVIYTCVQKINLEYDSANVGDITTEPFIILIGGSDSRNYKNLFNTSNVGRTDVNMLLVANPTTKQVLIITIPRDSYVALWGDSNCMDKLTHASVYGISAWQKTVNALFDVKINYFFRVNFVSIVKIIDALGGLKINNPYEFHTYSGLDSKTYEPHQYAHFPEGEIVLTGGQAIGYVRERYGKKPDGSNIGDLGRNEHQAIVVDALIKQVTSVSTIVNISSLLTAVEGTFFTDISIDSIYALAQMQLNDMAVWKVTQHHLKGSGGSRPSHAMGGRLLSMVILNTKSVNQAKELIKKVLNNEVIE